MNTIYDLSDTSNRGEPVAAASTAVARCCRQHREQVRLTPQYQGLQELHEQYGPQGLVVLGFPCDQFAHQEPGDDDGDRGVLPAQLRGHLPAHDQGGRQRRGTDPVFEFVKDRSKAS